MTYKPTIGLEVHVALSTHTKLFCGCSTKFGETPNSQLCPVCLGLPGALPVLNKRAVEFAVKMGLLLNCDIQRESSFDRKSYFYPDLVKGYQITQFYHPIALNGLIQLEHSSKKVGIKRIHLEEDAGKTTYTDEGILLDYNRGGIPLVEIVTEPDISSGQEAREFLQQIRELLLFADICDCKLEEGNMRVDVNISVSKSNVLGNKTEIKNLNSFKNIEKAIDQEIIRQISILESNERVSEQTLGWDDKLNELYIMRDKETTNQYMFFPEYDLPGITLDETYLREICSKMPKTLGEIKRELEALGLNNYQMQILTQSKDLYDLFISIYTEYQNPLAIANTLLGDMARYLNENKISVKEINASPKSIAEVIEMIDSGSVSVKSGKDLLYQVLESNEQPKELVEKLGILQIDDESYVAKLADKVIGENPSAIKEFIEGKEKVFGFLLGKVIKESQGRANPNVVNKILKEKIEKTKE